MNIHERARPCPQGWARWSSSYTAKGDAKTDAPLALLECAEVRCGAGGLRYMVALGNATTRRVDVASPWRTEYTSVYSTHGRWKRLVAVFNALLYTADYMVPGFGRNATVPSVQCAATPPRTLPPATKTKVDTLLSPLLPFDGRTPGATGNHFLCVEREKGRCHQARVW